MVFVWNITKDSTGLLFFDFEFFASIIYLVFVFVIGRVKGVVDSRRESEKLTFPLADNLISKAK